MFDEVSWLEQAGHEVAHFSTRHPDNVASPYGEYFAEYTELGSGAKRGVAESLRAALRMFHNRDAARRFERLVDDFKPDIVHVHGIHRQISPSILAVTSRRNLPVVQTLHDYQRVCPSDVLLRRGSEVCEPRSCGRLSYTACIRNRCVRGSLAASTLAAAEVSFQRMIGAYERGVTRFVSPSRFLADRMAEGGWHLPIDVIGNAVPLRDRAVTSDSRGTYFLFAGRLSPEKGVDVLLRAAATAGVRVVIAGDGPLAGGLRAAAGPNVEFLGHIAGEEAERLASGARAVVVPSVWYENAPMSVLEAMAAGTAVIASRIGGIPEQVTDGVEGILVEPGDADALAGALRALEADSSMAVRMGTAGRERVEHAFSPSRHLEALLATYERARAEVA